MVHFTKFYLTVNFFFTKCFEIITLRSKPKYISIEKNDYEKNDYETNIINEIMDR
jgi:hypothetical protein